MSLADRQAQRRYELCSALETGDGQTIGNTGNYYSPIKFDMLPAGAAVSFGPCTWRHRRRPPRWTLRSAASAPCSQARLASDWVADSA